MNLHPALHKALLAGAARAPLGPDSVDAALAPVIAPKPGLWHLVAATDVWQRAGFTPTQATAVQAAPCPPAPTCPRGAERVLQMIVAGIHAEQLPAWLALAHRHGKPLPHGVLVPLLELGTQKPALRAALAPVLGQRGHWLVAQHPEWSVQYSGAADIDTDWQLGSVAQRAAALLAMRRADPAAGLAALDTAWASEPPENRIAFLPALAQGLGLQDEAFLERALDDKRKEVRGWAQRLLVAVPGTQLVERCKARLAVIFGGVLPQASLALPATCDKAMKRDGIGVDTQRGLGEKAGWLFDLLCCVPPAHWSTAAQMAPQAVLQVFGQHEFGTALVPGLVQACSRTLGSAPTQEARDWYVMLATEDLPAASVLARDVVRLPQPDQERIVQRWLAAGTLRADAPALQWAEQRYNATADTMPLALSQQLLARAQQAMLAIAQPGYEAQAGLAILGRTLHPAVLCNWAAPDWEHWPQWRDPVDKLMDTLQFRTTMHASFLETDE